MFLLRLTPVIIDPPVIAADKIDCLVITVSSRESHALQNRAISHTLCSNKSHKYKASSLNFSFSITHIMFSMKRISSLCYHHPWNNANVYYTFNKNSRVKQNKSPHESNSPFQLIKKLKFPPNGNNKVIKTEISTKMQRCHFIHHITSITIGYYTINWCDKLPLWVITYFGRRETKQKRCTQVFFASRLIF